MSSTHSTSTSLARLKNPRWAATTPCASKSWRCASIARRHAPNRCAGRGVAKVTTSAPKPKLCNNERLDCWRDVGECECFRVPTFGVVVGLSTRGVIGGREGGLQRAVGVHRRCDLAVVRREQRVRLGPGGIVDEVLRGSGVHQRYAARAAPVSTTSRTSSVREAILVGSAHDVAHHSDLGRHREAFKQLDIAELGDGFDSCVIEFHAQNGGRGQHISTGNERATLPHDSFEKPNFIFAQHPFGQRCPLRLAGDVEHQHGRECVARTNRPKPLRDQTTFLIAVREQHRRNQIKYFSRLQRAQLEFGDEWMPASGVSTKHGEFVTQCNVVAHHHHHNEIGVWCFCQRTPKRSQNRRIPRSRASSSTTNGGPVRWPSRGAPSTASRMTSRAEFGSSHTSIVARSRTPARSIA